MPIIDNRTLLQRCELFLDLQPIEITHDFEDKYCPGQVYYIYANKEPDNFVRKVMEFSKSNQDNAKFQALVRRHLSSPAVQESSAPEKKQIVTENEPVVDKKTPTNHIEPKKFSSPQLKSKAEKQSFRKIPFHPYTEDELRRSIEEKLFTQPYNHDRYTRLTQEEKQFIIYHAGLSQKELDVFKIKSRRTYYKYSHIAKLLRCSTSTIKQLAVKIDIRIRNMLENLASK